ncbi:MAG: hypothetical protein ABUL67_03215 [Haliangium ochraceum]
MRTTPRGTLALQITVALAAAGCSTNLASTTHDAGTDTQLVSQPMGTNGCTGNPHASAEVPTEHRPVATACAPSSRSPAVPDGGLRSCTTNADCAADGGLASLFSTCLHGQCSFDQCLTDADCGAHGLCACAADYYGGNVAYHPNICVQGNCRVDSDCGSAGFCSPSRGHCGSFEGFYCHTPKDTCVDATKDCGGCAPSCTYSPAAATFVCGGSACAG